MTANEHLGRAFLPRSLYDTARFKPLQVCFVSLNYRSSQSYRATGLLSKSDAAANGAGHCTGAGSVLTAKQGARGVFKDEERKRQTVKAPGRSPADGGATAHWCHSHRPFSQFYRVAVKILGIQPAPQPSTSEGMTHNEQTGGVVLETNTCA